MLIVQWAMVNMGRSRDPVVSVNTIVYHRTKSVINLFA